MTPPDAASWMAAGRCLGSPWDILAWVSTIHSDACAHRMNCVSWLINGIAVILNGQPNRSIVSEFSHRTPSASSGGGAIIVRPTGDTGNGRRIV